MKSTVMAKWEGILDKSQYLLFIETSGNQGYIYATNKLRENIGASELTYRAGTQWVMEAAGFADAPTGQPQAYREWLTRGPAKDGVEVVLATSGKALLLVDDQARAREILAALTTRAAKDAPGLSVAGAVVALKSRKPHDVASAIGDAHRRFNANRELMPTPAQRFSMLPFCEPCNTSGLPASALETMANESLPYAAPTLAKRSCVGGWFARIRQVFRDQEDDFFVGTSVDQLERDFDDLSWVGVVYSDGNGLGQIMMQFDQWLDPDPADDYLATLRAFSVELDAATEAAFYQACRHLHALGAAKDLQEEGKHLPVVPLLLGGDDLTALVHGRYALPFARHFLEAFERETNTKPTIARIASRALGVPRLSACAGVANVKSHFPFHSAHVLAESLLRSAKIVKSQVKQVDKEQPYPCSALDFHILFDAAFSSLAALRDDRRTARDRVRLWGGPYVVTEPSLLVGARGADWARAHHLDALIERVDALNRGDADGRALLPRSTLHMLREALHQGRQVADARLAEARRLQPMGIGTLCETATSLFDDAGATRFVDALISAEFWGGTAQATSAAEEGGQ